MPRPIARIDLSTFRRNVDLVRHQLPTHCGVMVVVKADAYGHGIEAVSRAAQDVGIERLGAATVEEGKAIRRAGVALPVLLLDPILRHEFPAALSADLEFSIDTLEAARAASEAARALGGTARVHVDADLGMRRFGVLPERLLSLLAEVAALPSLRIEGVSGHLPRADSGRPKDEKETRAAIAALSAALRDLDQRGVLPPLRHVGNSAAVIRYPDEVTCSPFNLVRIGTLLYGYPEVRRPWTAHVQPIATLTAQAIALKEVAEGEWVGYGRTWQAPSRRRVAVLAIGYADGLPPALGNRGSVALRGKRAPFVGRVCLDHALVDVTEIDGVRVGDTAEVLGPNLPADEAAAAGGLAVCELLVPALRGAERTHA